MGLPHSSGFTLLAGILYPHSQIAIDRPHNPLAAPRAPHVRFMGMRFLLCFVASVALLCASGELSGRRAPGFSLNDLHLRQHDLADYRGKIVVLEVFQTTCPLCQQLAAVLEKLQAKYDNKIAVLSIANPPDNQTTVRKFVAEYKVSTPVLFDCGQVAVSYFKATPQNPSVNVPHVFLIDGEGMIRGDFGYDFDTHNMFEGDGLDLAIDKMLGDKAPAKSKQ